MKQAMSILDRWRAHRRRVLGIDELTRKLDDAQRLTVSVRLEVAQLRAAVDEIRGMMGLPDDPKKAPTGWGDPHGL